MQHNARLAFNELKKIGAPVIKNGDGAHFCISGEDNINDIWADYFNMGADWLDFGVSKKITAILDKYDLYCEWQNPGCLGVYDA